MDLSPMPSLFRHRSSQQCGGSEGRRILINIVASCQKPMQQTRYTYVEFHWSFDSNTWTKTNRSVNVGYSSQGGVFFIEVYSSHGGVLRISLASKPLGGKKPSEKIQIFVPTTEGKGTIHAFPSSQPDLLCKGAVLLVALIVLIMIVALVWAISTSGGSLFLGANLASCSSCSLFDGSITHRTTPRFQSHVPSDKSKKIWGF